MASHAKITSYSCKLEHQIVTIRKSLIQTPMSCKCNGDDVKARYQPKAVIDDHLSAYHTSPKKISYFLQRPKKLQHSLPKTKYSVLNPALLRVRTSASTKSRSIAHNSMLHLNDDDALFTTEKSDKRTKNVLLFAKSKELPIVPPDLPSPAQLSFILDKLRTEVHMHLLYFY